MADQAEALRYAVRPHVLAKYFGQLCLVVVAFALLPLAVALVSGEMPIALRYVIVLVPIGLLGGWLSRIHAGEDVQINEGVVLVASMFAATPLFMTYPLMGAGMSFTDALFEAVSGVTTTGLSTLRTVEDKPAAFLFARAWMQWYGGLGIVVFSLALLFRPGMVAKRLSGAQANLIASLVGRSLGFKRVITRIQDPEFEMICRELGLEDTIIPSRTIGRYLADMLEGLDILELSTVIRGEARFYSFSARKEDAVTVAELNLPERAKVVCYYRGDRFFLADEKTRLREKDEVVILTHSENLQALRERWEPKNQ